MGKKYIIEQNDECNSEFKGIMVFGLTQEKQISVELIPEESLRPYTEPDLEQVKADAYNDGYKAGREAEKVRQKIRQPDLEQVRKEAYEDGYKTAKVQCNIQAEKDLREVGERHYQKGLSDAWEAARKIWQSDIYRRIFKVTMRMDCFTKFSASEVIEEIRAYEQAQKEKEEQIQVGDEVENTQTGVKFIVTHLWENNRGEQGVSGFNLECSAFSTTLDLVVKTGRHFPEIAAVLQKMKDGK